MVTAAANGNNNEEADLRRRPSSAGCYIRVPRSLSLRSFLIFLSTTTMRIRSLLLATTLPTLTQSYASWLKCYVELDESEVVMNDFIQSYADASTKVELVVRGADGGAWFSELKAASGRLVHAKLQNVPANAQFVMEVSEGGRFVGSQQCDGRRVHGSGDQEFALELLLENSSGTVEVVAGWAQGHEAVKLTSRATVSVMVAEEVEEEDL